MVVWPNLLSMPEEGTLREPTGEVRHGVQSNGPLWNKAVHDLKHGTCEHTMVHGNGELGLLKVGHREMVLGYGRGWGKVTRECHPCP